MTTIRTSNPPGISGSLASNALLLMKNPLSFLEKQAEESGPFFKANLGFLKAWVSTEPEHFRYVLKSNQENYYKGEGFKFFSILLGKGLITNNGESWKSQRRLIQPTFHRRSLQELYNIMCSETEKFATQLESKKGKKVQLDKEMATLTLRIVTRALFSTDIEEDENELLEAFEFYTQYVGDLSANPTRSVLYNLNGRERRFRKLLKKTDRLIYKLIEKRRTEESERYDLLAMLMGARDEESGEAMDDKMLRDEIMTFFFAGHETSANALNWTWYLLSQHEEIAKKVREESFEMLGDGIPEFTQVTQLQYAKQVIQESMRLYPPVWILFRSNHEIDHLGDFEIPKDAFVALSVYGLHRNPDVWDNPLEFDPSRFEPEKVKERDAFAYLPFGGGPRICIGNHFAMLETQMILSVLSRRFRFEYTDNIAPVPRPLITLSPWKGMPVKVHGLN